MSLKVFGAILVVVACGGVGLMLASAHVREERLLRQLIAVLDYMECELQYRLTPLPQLCRNAAAQGKGVIQDVFLTLATELEDQISPDVEHCVMVALSKMRDIPVNLKEIFEQLGHTLGRFDLEGQVKGLESARQDCRYKLSELEKNREIRLRSYQTLGLCAGAALVILFI